MLFLYILLGVILALLALSLSRVSCHIDYEYIGKTQKASLSFHFFKIIKVRIPLSLEKNKKGKSKNTEEKASKKKKFSFENLKLLFKNIESAFSDSKNDIFSLLASLKDHLSIDKLVLELEYGLADAAKTGMANGAIWAAASGALSAIDNFSEIKSGGLNIYPVFDRECLNLRFSGIISLKIAHIISIGITVLKIINSFAKNLAKDE